MWETIVFLFGIWAFLTGLKNKANIFLVVASILFIVSATGSVHENVDYVEVNSTLEKVEYETYNYPVLYASWGFTIMTIGLVLMGLFDYVKGGF